VDTPRPSPRTNRTRRVPHPVLIGHAGNPKRLQRLFAPPRARCPNNRRLMHRRADAAGARGVGAAARRDSRGHAGASCAAEAPRPRRLCRQRRGAPAAPPPRRPAAPPPCRPAAPPPRLTRLRAEGRCRFFRARAARRTCRWTPRVRLSSQRTDTVPRACCIAYSLAACLLAACLLAACLLAAPPRCPRGCGV
jgi:hypothetical protein